MRLGTFSDKDIGSRIGCPAGALEPALCEAEGSPGFGDWDTTNRNGRRDRQPPVSGSGLGGRIKIVPEHNVSEIGE